MNKFLSRISLPMRFALLGLVSVIVCAVPCWLYVGEARKVIEATELESQGVPPARAVLGVIRLAQQHRGLANQVLSGAAAAAADRVTREQQVDAALQAADALVKADPGAAKAWNEARADWDKIRRGLQANSLTARDSFTAHTTMIADLQKAMERIVDNYGLSLDPEGYTYFLASGALMEAPKLLEDLARMRGTGAGILAAKATTPEDRVTMSSLAEVSRDRFDSLQADYRKAMDARPAAAPALKTALDSAEATTNKALQVVQSEIVGAKTLAMAPLDFFAQFSQAVDAHYKLDEFAIGALESALTERTTTLKRTLYTLGGIVGLLFALGGLFAFVISRSVTVPLNDAVRLADAVANGELAAEPQARANDETGRLLSAMDRMVGTLKDMVAAQAEILSRHSAGEISYRIPVEDFRGSYKTLVAGTNDLAASHIAVKMRIVDVIKDYAAGRFETTMDRLPGEKAKITEAIDNVRDGLATAADEAATALRIKNALDCTSVNVMIADSDGNIVYVNKAVATMLANAEADLRAHLPNFDARKIVGSNFDSFHKNPAHQRNLLGQLQGQHKAAVRIGARSFGLVANPIFDAAGKRVGSVVEWLDRTLEVAVQEELASIVAGAAAGDFTRRVTLEGKEGFFKTLADSLNTLLETSDVGLNEVVRVLAALAKGDLTERITNDYDGTFGRLKNDSNETSAQLTTIVRQIRETTNSIATAAKEIASGNSDLSQRTEEQASSLEETASSMEELTATVKQNADNARQANQLAASASEVAVKGGAVVGEVVETMNAISDSSKKIADIIGVIDGIAFQTNILALNAAVEAARAGEQGRGFAVVASEVRSLAQRSAGAAKEIKTLIGDSVDKVASGAQLVANAGQTMGEIVSSVKRVTDIMAEITAASAEQSSGIEQINQAIAQMDQVTQQNAALVEQAAAAAASMEEQSANLATAVSVFRLDQDATVAVPGPQRLPAPPRGAAHKPAHAMRTSHGVKPQPRAVAAPGEAGADGEAPAAHAPARAARPAGSAARDAHAVRKPAAGKRAKAEGENEEDWAEF